MLLLFILNTVSAISFDTYTLLQSKAALNGILGNSNQYPGVIAASLATDTARAGESGGQNYYYQWTRDAALTMKTIINQFASGDTTLEPFIKAYITNEQKLQRLNTLSGDFKTGGLAEPKYYMNSTVFDGPWGRPQRDGPALRAIAIMGYLSLVNDTSYINNVTENVVKPDLDYVADNWRKSGFDLWEEQNGTHFFTAMVQSRALQDGAAFMLKSNATAAFTYLAQDHLLGQVIDSFWNATGGTFDAKLNSSRPTGADCANLLASIHGSKRYSPSSDKILASTNVLIREMSGLYPIGTNSSAVLVGRYASDVYDGIQTSEGNPWFLCNSAVAEVLYVAATQLSNTTVAVNSINHGIISRLLPSAQQDTILNPTDVLSLRKGMTDYADAFLELEQRFVGANYSMSEQVNRTTGHQQGAHDLTWSYAAFISAIRARAGQSTYDFAKGFPGNALIANSTTSNTTSSITTLTKTTVSSKPLISSGIFKDEQHSSALAPSISLCGVLFSILLSVGL